MKKKLLLLFSVFITCSFGLINVEACTRDNTNCKPSFKVDGVTLYGGLRLLPKDNGSEAFFSDVDVNYDASSNTFIYTAKRSKLNKIDTSKYSVHMVVDYHNINKEEKIHLVNKHENDNDYCYLSQNTATKDLYWEIFESGINIYPGSYNSGTSPYTYLLIKGDFYNNHNYSKCYGIEEFYSQKILLKLDNPKYSFNIIEDVKNESNQPVNNSNNNNNNQSNNQNSSSSTNTIPDTYSLNSDGKTYVQVVIHDEKGEPPSEIVKLYAKIDNYSGMDDILEFFDNDDNDYIQILYFTSNLKNKYNYKVKFLVSEEYDDKGRINIYKYDKNDESLELVTNNLKIDADNYIEFECDELSTFVITTKKMSDYETEPGSDVIIDDYGYDEKSYDENELNGIIFLLIIYLISVVVINIIGSIIILIVGLRKKK